MSLSDIYEDRGLPDSKKSMTFRFVIGSREMTLSSSEIDDFSERLLGFI